MCYMGYEEMITAEWIEKIYKEHQKIYECILDENADDASAAMKEHLENCQSRVRHWPYPALANQSDLVGQIILSDTVSSAKKHFYKWKTKFSGYRFSVPPNW